MTELTLTRKELETLVNEHDAIIDKIEEIIDWWTQLEAKGIPKFSEMGMHVNELRVMLADHYAEEEKLDCYNQIRNEFPKMEINKDNIQEEHKKLLDQLDKFSKKLDCKEPCFKNWNEALEQFNAILKEFHEHETYENQIILRALEKIPA